MSYPSKFIACLAALSVCATASFAQSTTNATSGSTAALAKQPQLPWKQWVAALRVDAIADGIKPSVFDEAFKDVHAPSKSIMQYDRAQPEKRLPFLKYRNTRADAYRIKLGQQELLKNKALLNEVSQQYGVSPCFIMSFWGLETSYGRFMGSFPVIQSLATLAYDQRRGDFFRGQLLHALHILNEGHVDPAKFKGEWAGASGHPQFLPSSWHKYAVDQNGDGHKDIWTTMPDVFASISNYLIQNGWKPNEPWAIPVNVSSAAQPYVATKQQLSLEQWRKMGVTIADGRPWPEDQNLMAELILPDGGPAFLAFNNFNVIMKWNRSNYYAGTVGYMAEKICNRPL